MDIFGSSGGAVNGLALVTTHPSMSAPCGARAGVGPAAAGPRQVMAACEAIHDAYLREGFGPAMASSSRVSYAGPIPAGFADEPGPDPASFGLPVEDDGSRDDPLVGLNILRPLVTGTISTRSAKHRSYRRAGANRPPCGRPPGTAVAERLGTAPVTFTGGHDGFLGGEYSGGGALASRTPSPSRF